MCICENKLAFVLLPNEFGTSSVHACRSASMRARAPSKHADRRTCLDIPRASTQIGEHTCTWPEQACRSANMRAGDSCKHADRRACVHVLRAELHIGTRAYSGLALALTR